jgi:hypothetical protein
MLSTKATDAAPFQTPTAVQQHAFLITGLWGLIQLHCSNSSPQHLTSDHSCGGVPSAVRKVHEEAWGTGTVFGALSGQHLHSRSTEWGQQIQDEKDYNTATSSVRH